MANQKLIYFSKKNEDVYDWLEKQCESVNESANVVVISILRDYMNSMKKEVSNDVLLEEINKVKSEIELVKNSLLTKTNHDLVSLISALTNQKNSSPIEQEDIKLHSNDSSKDKFKPLNINKVATDDFV